MKKAAVKIVAQIMKRRGYSYYYGPYVFKEVIDDIFKNKQNTLKEKIWAYRRGFLSYKIQQYGLTEDNYASYLSDFDYYKLYPINNEFKVWIDDKLTTKYVLSTFKEYLPEYYCHIKKKKEIIPLMDAKVIKNVDDIVHLLEEKKELAVKPSSSTFGVGFYKISYVDNSYFINSKRCADKDELLGFLDGLEDYLITEYIKAHSEIRKISDFGLNTLRVMVINEPGKEPILANGLMRFSTKRSGAVDNGFAGGIFSIVDMETGRYHDAKRMENNHIVNHEVHPDTNVKIEGALPHWELINEKISEICKYLSEVKYMGFDIAITDDSFKIIEINSHQGIAIFQFYYPLLENNKATSFFKEMISV